MFDFSGLKVSEWSTRAARELVANQFPAKLVDISRQFRFDKCQVNLASR